MFENSARVLNVFERPAAVLRTNVDGASAFDDDMNLEALADRIKRRVPDAIILREAANPKTVDSCSTQAFSEVGPAECRVAVGVGTLGLADDLNICGKF